MKKEYGSWVFLLLIPMQLLICVLQVGVGIIMDGFSWGSPTSPGHPIPVFYILSLIVAVVEFVIMFVASVALTIGRVIKRSHMT